MDQRAVHCFVRGRVQGVWYRASAQKEAERLGLTGWVRNCDDGSVEIHAEGDEGTLEQFINWCHQGPALAKVTEVERHWVPSENHTSFSVK